MGDRILQYVETYFNSLYKIDYSGFLGIIMDLLNAGPDCYRKILFACLSINNQGRICEHDIFNLLEQFKQRESFFFYQDLIT